MRVSKNENMQIILINLGPLRFFPVTAAPRPKTAYRSPLERDGSNNPNLKSFGHILSTAIFFVKAKIQLNVSLFFLSTTSCG
jgi:hypothetical protein